ncbi:MAG: diadenylate cyclase CdaA [Candidatus Sumerlaeia bacterium]|nr:diadenylate cyclase CdaA [Candidatus Sumerlaeia bacterium]
MGEFADLYLPQTFVDILDIAMVATIFYLLFALLRETRSAVALQGLVTLLLFSFLVYFLAETAGLNAVTLIFRSFWIVIVLVFIVTFQHEFKRALTSIGQMRLFRVFFTPSVEFLDELVRAVSMMAKQRMGAILAIERINSLKVYADTGIPLDALVTTETLRTIFTRPSPLHDGAVIIRGDRIVAASCILPLSNNPTLEKELGTRHRAAVGLSEETDAVVIVVSEETGIISLAHNGNLERRQTPESLRNILAELLKIRPEET